MKNMLKFFMGLDGVISSTAFEIYDGLRRWWIAYSNWLLRFRITGIKRIIVDLLDDVATFGTVFALGIIAIALPTLKETDDIWNSGRRYAVTFTDSNGEIIGRRGVLQDDAIPLEEIPPHLVKAVLATEDIRFFQHFGVDVLGTARAMVANAKAQDVVQGGSTLTQQLAKNLFLSPERSLRRKVHEAFLALWIEARLSKAEILKMYLDRTYLGGGTYGMEAASQYYFGKSVRDVNLPEAAILAGLFKAPSSYAPHVNPEAAKNRSNVVLGRMLDVGYITQGELLEASRNTPQIIRHETTSNPDYFLDWAYKETLQLIDEYKLTDDYVVEVKTTIDLAMQKAAKEEITTTLTNEGPRYNATQAALVSMTPSGAVKAIIGGRDYEESQFNRATDALRQPGSSFKPFVYLAALLSGMKPETAIVDGPITIGNWSPKNYSNRYAGRTNLITALAKSYNTVPVRIMTQVGRKKIIDSAHLVGVQSEIMNVPAMVLGPSEITVLDITRGYATFANNGVISQPHTVLEMRRASGELIYSRERNAPKPKQVIPREVAADMNRMLGQVVTAGTARRADLGYTPVAGKTGTTQSYRDAWFVGFSGKLVTGVWYGNDDYSPTNNATGGSIPASTWKAFMLRADTAKAPVSLLGLPATAQHQAFLDANRNTLENVGGPEVQIAAIDPEAETTTDGSNVNPKDDAVVNVLRDMFTLFKKQETRVRVINTKRKTSNSGNNNVRIISSGGNGRKNNSAHRQQNAQRLRQLLQSR
ncbi:MAG: PBP1A family penicillin-binding protein [Anderseniella sp.]